MPEAAPLYLELADYCFPELKSVPENKKLDGLLAKTSSLSTDLGLKSTLSEVGVKETDLELLAGDAMKQTRLLVNNPREMTYDAAFDIYKRAL